MRIRILLLIAASSVLADSAIPSGASSEKKYAETHWDGPKHPDPQLCEQKPGSIRDCLDPCAIHHCKDCKHDPDPPLWEQKPGSIRDCHPRPTLCEQKLRSDGFLPCGPNVVPLTLPISSKPFVNPRRGRYD